MNRILRGLRYVGACLLVLTAVSAQAQISDYPASGAGSSDTVTRFKLTDEFITGTLTTGGIGSLGWSLANGTAGGSAGEANRPGIFGLSACGAAATCAFFANVSVYGTQVQNIESLQWIYRSTTVANEPKRRLGVTVGVTTDAPANSVYFERLAADTNWFCVTRAASAETRVDTGVAFASATWVRLELLFSASAIQCRVNGTTSVFATLTIPAGTVAVMPFVHHVGTGTASAFDVDRFELGVVTTGR